MRSCFCRVRLSFLFSSCSRSHSASKRSDRLSSSEIFLRDISHGGKARYMTIASGLNVSYCSRELLESFQSPFFAWLSPLVGDQTFAIFLFIGLLVWLKIDGTNAGDKGSQFFLAMHLQNGHYSSSCALLVAIPFD